MRVPLKLELGERREADIMQQNNSAILRSETLLVSVVQGLLAFQELTLRVERQAL